VLPNGVDLDTFQSIRTDYSGNDTILFTGNMDYAPNVDAVIYFKQSILPLITSVSSDVRFVIAGQRPTKEVLELADENTIVTGFVASMASMYEQASVVVSPLRFGAGTQNKVLEAMAMGLPVVCSNIGFEGLDIANGSGIFCETEPQPFADRVLALLQHETLRRTTGVQAAKQIRQRFDWERVALLLENYLKGDFTSPPEEV
jgi:glycosyltransferase involved in cell wall biosynthesis